ncbi:MAG: DUF885 domain-containing protein [Flavobacteriales bacterium]|nr:DUF885 domain-containing protein [Flavobacteriales bacterium]
MRTAAGIAVLVGFTTIVHAQAGPRAVLDDFTTGHLALAPEPFALDLRERLALVPSDSVLAAQERFFREQQHRLSTVEAHGATQEEGLLLDLARFETAHQLERIALERRWTAAGRPMPVNGVHDLPDAADWYRLLVRRFTGYARTPQELIAFGEAEVERCHRAIERLHAQLGGAPGPAWITDKAEMLWRFARLDSTVRAHLAHLVGPVEVPPVAAMEWPGADAHTPPGIYLSRDDNAYGADVFQFNFHLGRFDARALDWIYLHESIPGHHLQWSLRQATAADDLRVHLLYPGNFEGWACYVEYAGKELGAYADPVQELGKWEWDLVRSVRVVLDAGIHGLGWSRAEAMAYWERHIPGRPDLAEREVTRVTHWAAQALSYKVGADAIQRLRDRLAEALGPRFDAARFHRTFLDLGMVPLPVAETHLTRTLSP